MKTSIALRLLIALFAALPLRALAQSDGSRQPPPAPAAPPVAATPPAATMPPAAEQPQPSKPAVAEATSEQPAAQAAPAEQPSAQDDARSTPPPPEPAPVVPPPPVAQPESAVAATASASPPAEVEEEEDSSMPFIASLSWTHAYNAAGLNRSAYQTFNPQYAWTFNAVVGYRFDDRTSIALSQAVAIELTDSDTTNTRQEPWFLDTAIDGERELLAYEIDDEHEFGTTLALGILLPTSKPSRAATMMFAGRARVGAHYTAEDVLHGLTTGVTGSYAHRFLESTVLTFQQERPCAPPDLRDVSRNCVHAGPTNTRDLFVLGVEAELGLVDKLTLGANVSFGWALAAGLEDDQVTLETGTVVTLGDGSPSRWRNTRVIGLSLEYAFTDWFSGATLFTNSFPERSGDSGQYRAPLNGQDLVLGLELSVSFDALYESTHGHAGGS